MTKYYEITIILSIILIIVIIIFSINDNNVVRENFESTSINNEALQNIASIYNKKQLVVDNLSVTKDFSTHGLSVDGISTTSC
jgi:hypothetical protein